MKDFDMGTDFESPHNQDYDQLVDLIGDDHELLRLDTLMREVLGRDPEGGE